MKNLIDRYKKRRRDAGAGLVDAVVGIGLASIIVGGPILYFTTVNNAAAGNASTQEQNTSISEALDRAVANIQASDTIKYAAPNELVTSSTEVEAGKADNPVITRWVVNGGKLYQQIWSGTAGVAAYDRSTLPTSASGTATLDTRVSVDNLQLDGNLFTYTDKDGAVLDVTAPKAALTEAARTVPADGKKTYDIALVNIDLKAGTNANGGKTGIVENKTSAAPRSVSGKADTPASTAACAAVRVDTNAAGKPVITWSTLPGYTSYAVLRNDTQAGIVTAAASDAQASFTDTTVTPGPSEVINYRVQPRNADGTLGAISCTPKPWSPQIAAPAFRNSGVLPSADQAHEWTDGTDGALGLKKPRIALQWAAVPGATGYDLKYRELDPATGTPLTTAFNSAAAGLPAATTTFTWDEGGWGASYEWFIKANGGAGQGQSAESAHITTLTHPAAPQNVDVTPQYGTGSDRMTKGNNVITWSASATAVEYDIWRYNSGSSGAVTKLATIPAASPRTYTDTVPYGTTWTYYVAAINDGPRGTTSGKASSANPEAGVTAATGTMPTVSYREPAAGTAIMSTAVYRGGTATIVPAAVSQPNVQPAPQPVSQLQFPPIPSISAVSAAAGQTRDLDGSNQVVWAPTLSATGYLPARVTPMTSQVTCLAGDCQAGTGGLTGTSLTDPAAKGTQFDYYVKAVNPTGVSVDFSAKVRLTQRPAKPVLSTSKAPDLSTSGATFTSTANADSGNDGANKFCTSATCKYELSRNGTAVSTLDQPAAGSGSTLTWSTSSNPEGVTLTFSARAKNEAVTNGGFSDPVTTTVNTYPGDFSLNKWLGDASGKGRERFMADLTSTDVAGSSTTSGTPGQTTIGWGSSAGAASITTTRKAVANDTVTTDGSLGLPMPADDDPKVFTGGNSGTQSGWAAPGATYNYTVVAKGQNGLTRTHTSGNLMTPADLPHHAIVQITCSNNTYTNQTTALWDWPDHYVGARMIDLDHAPLYGAWAGTSIWGLQLDKGAANFSNTNGVWLVPTDGNPNVNAGPGHPYYYGVTSGFDIQNAGDNGGPPSARLRLTLGAYATFNSGCGPYHGTWDQLSEPTYPCYGYVPGTPCKAVNNSNRPQWTTK